MRRKGNVKFTKSRRFLEVFNRKQNGRFMRYQMTVKT